MMVMLAGVTALLSIKIIRILSNNAGEQWMGKVVFLLSMEMKWNLLWKGLCSCGIRTYNNNTKGRRAYYPSKSFIWKIKSISLAEILRNMGGKSETFKPLSKRKLSKSFLGWFVFRIHSEMKVKDYKDFFSFRSYYIPFVLLFILLESWQKVLKKYEYYTMAKCHWIIKPGRG